MLLSRGLSILVVLLNWCGCQAQNADVTSKPTGISKLVTYPVPSGLPTESTFDVRVRSPGRLWQTLGTYQVTVEEVNTTKGNSQTYGSSMTYFDFSGSVEISVRYLLGPVSSVEIRPYSYGIVPSAVGNNVYEFTLSKPMNVVFQVNGDIFHVLNIFSNPIEKGPPNSDDPNVIYFGPGMHNVTGGVLYVNSSQTLYLAGGATLASSIVFQNATNAAIRGRGILYKPSSNAITVAYGSNVTIEGITVVNTKYTSLLIGQSTGITISNVRAFSATSYGDGIDLYSTTNTVIEKVFMRTSDDCIAIYNHRNDWYGNSTNITIKDSSLWADVAHPINLATHGNADDPETLSDLTISNIDILDHREPQMLYQGCIAINPGDENTVRDVLIEDIRVEDFRAGQLVNMRIMYNPKWNAAPGKLISNITIRNLNYNGNHSTPSILTGYDETRRIEFITFQNLTVNGQHIYDAMQKPSWYLTSDFVPMFANEHVTNLTFLA
ncbi:putative transmembrane protein [Hypoxylon crocopeplum]|nr:putative transmembrane protein [Hypoxylon crocopeplum]